MRNMAIITLAVFTVPLVLAGAALAQGFNDSQTGHAQNAQNLSGLHNPNTQVHDPNISGTNAYTAPGSGPVTTATSPNGAAQPMPGMNQNAMSGGMQQNGAASSSAPR